MNTVLITDDNPKVIKLLRRMLQNEPYEVIEAADGNECVELFQQYSPAAVLIDIIMPGKDGLTAIQEIKALNCQAKIVAMSGGLVFTAGVYLEEADACGADRTLSKPLNRRQLIGTIDSLLKEKALN